MVYSLNVIFGHLDLQGMNLNLHPCITCVVYIKEFTSTLIVILDEELVGMACKEHIHVHVHELL